MDPSESQTMEQVIARLDKLEAQLNERLPPLEQKVAEGATLLALVRNKLSDQHKAFQHVEAPW